MNFFVTETSKTGLKSLQKGNKTNGSAFAVYKDVTAPSSRLPSATGEWKQPPTNSKIVKENTQKPGQWNKGKVSRIDVNTRCAILFNL